MQDENSLKFDILRLLAMAGAKGDDLSKAAETALAAAAEYVGLTAAALYVWDEHFNTTLTVTYADADKNKDRIAQLEKELFARLRKEKKLLSAYMSFGGDAPSHSFSLPLLQGDMPFGAVIGLQEGQKTIVAEDVFLEALASVLAVSFAAQGKDHIADIEPGLLDKERLAAIIETAVTVNHEVNNPLTAILGNVQLLLLKRQDLDDDLKEKLRVIEASAMKIKDVTQRLMRLTTPRSVEYSDGTKMVDISDEEEAEK
jgi:signal transduction histidine kinase